MWTAKGGSTAVKGVIACSPPTYFDERPRPNFDKYIPKVQPNGRSIEFLPISVAQDIKTPLFLMHGKRDDVVSFDESERDSKLLWSSGSMLCERAPANGSIIHDPALRAGGSIQEPHSPPLPHLWLEAVLGLQLDHECFGVQRFRQNLGLTLHGGKVAQAEMIQ